MQNNILLPFFILLAMVAFTAYTFGFSRGVSFFKRSVDAYAQQIKDKIRAEILKEIGYANQGERNVKQNNKH